MPVVRPGVIVDHAVVSGKIDEVFDFMADFSNSVKWDPGVASSVRNEQGKLVVGSSFSLITVFKGKSSKMTYKVEELDKAKHRVVFTGNGAIIKAVDIIQLSEVENGRVRIDYTADLTLKSWRRPFVVFLKSAFDELGTAAMRGIENYFAHGDKAATAAVAGDSAKATPAATEPQAVAVSE